MEVNLPGGGLPGDWLTWRLVYLKIGEWFT